MLLRKLLRQFGCHPDSLRVALLLCGDGDAAIPPRMRGWPRGFDEVSVKIGAACAILGYMTVVACAPPTASLSEFAGTADGRPFATVGVRPRKIGSAGGLAIDFADHELPCLEAVVAQEGQRWVTFVIVRDAGVGVFPVSANSISGGVLASLTLFRSSPDGGVVASSLPLTSGQIELRSFDAVRVEGVARLTGAQLDVSGTFEAQRCP